MKHGKKLFSSLLTIGFFCALGITTVQSKFAAAPNYVANAEKAVSRKKDVKVAFDGETQVDEDELKVGISQSNTTETSQSILLNFRARTSLGFQPIEQNYIIQINDEHFSGDVSNPVREEGQEPYTRTYDYIDTDQPEGEQEKTVPLFDGIITHVTGHKSEEYKKDVYIPSFFVKKGKFAIAIKGISIGAVVDYTKLTNKNIENCWTRKNGNHRINNIYIPDTIEYIEEGAFTATPDFANFYYEGTELPIEFVEGWTDAAASQIHCDPNCYGDPETEEGKALIASRKEVFAYNDVDGLAPSTNFILGYKANDKYPQEEYNKPLTITYDVIKVDSEGKEIDRYAADPVEMPVESENNAYDGVGDIQVSTYARRVDVHLKEDERIDDETIVVHNIYGIKYEDKTYSIDLNKRYFVAPKLNYSVKIDLSDLVFHKHDQNAHLMGYSRFALKMDKNLTKTSEEYPEPHSYYLDLKSAIYEQNRLSIESGKTVIRYSLYNLYKASYCFTYVGKNNEIKTVEVDTNLTSGVYLQTLGQDKGNIVSCVVKDTDIAKDFAGSKVVKFEIKDLTIQMDLLTTSSSSGAPGILAKSAEAFTFAYLTVFDNGTKPVAVFNYDLLIILFVVGFIAVYSGLAFALYKIRKEKYKNDEFRRVNGKKYLKSAALGGLGATIFAMAILFIVIRFSGFSNTIVTYNPVDPFVIAFSIAGLIAFGYFVVTMVKLAKANKARRQAIRLRLDEDVDDDGTK